MNIEVDKSPDNTTIRINTRLIPGEQHFKEFTRIAEHINDFQTQNIIVDLLKCNYLDTRVIAIILEMHQALKKNCKVLKIVNVSDDIVDLFKAINLDKIIKIN